MNSRVNTRCADLGLPQFDLPPAEPVFSPNPVAELMIANTGGRITLKLRIPSPPAQFTLIQGAVPVRTNVRCVPHFTFLGLLPPPTDGWSDITELYVARYGVPRAGTAIWIRPCQHINGWTDAPKVTRARVPASAGPTGFSASSAIHICGTSEWFTLQLRLELPAEVDLAAASFKPAVAATRGDVLSITVLAKPDRLRS